MSRADQIAQWKQRLKPEVSAHARNRLNAERKKAQQLRRDTLKALVQKQGPRLFFHRGWQKRLADSLNVSVLTIHTDMRAIF